MDSSPTLFPMDMLRWRRLSLSVLFYFGTSHLTMADSGEPILSVVSKELGTSAYPLKECQGDCFGDDSNCAKGLQCFSGADSKTTPGCFGVEFAHIDFCYRPQNKNGDVFKKVGKSTNGKSNSKTKNDGNGGKMTSTDHKKKYLMLIETGSSPPPLLKECRGNCKGDDSCAPGLTCFKRDNINQEVPGCQGFGLAGINYCYYRNETQSENRSNGKSQYLVQPVVTYMPGSATVFENGLILSKGLKSRLIAESFKPVHIDKGMLQESEEPFHSLPDGAACFVDPNSPDPNRPNYKYVSNSESDTDGGIGAIEFSYDGEVLGYERLLRGRGSYNCGGGKTFYNTWLSCEEVDNGQVWEIIPYPRNEFEQRNQARQTLLGRTSYGLYESAAYDNRDPTTPRFFVSTDAEDGPLIRYTPSSSSVEYAISTNDYTQLLHAETDEVKSFGTENYRPAVHEYLKFDSSSTFTWTESLDEGRDSARNYYQYVEGVDVRDGKLFFVSKTSMRLFQLNLDAGTYESSSTTSGSFEGQPDTIVRLLNGPGSTKSTEGDEVLFFTEEADNGAGVHGRDRDGRYYTIIQAGPDMPYETSGLAFSPNNMRMYVAFQVAGKLFEISRLDGKPFGGQTLDIKYHSDSTNANRFPMVNPWNDDGYSYSDDDYSD